MNNLRRRPVLAAILLLLVGAVLFVYQAQAQADTPAPEEPAFALDTSLTYQGYLEQNGVPANGNYDFIFRLYDALGSGSQRGVAPDNELPVVDGIFTTVLNFGSAFDGTALWLQIEVRPSGSTGPYTVLSPRQPLTAAPYATTALQALDTTPYSAGIDLYGERSGEGGRGVYGFGASPSGVSDGVWGRSDSPQGRGVLGWATHSNGANYGVWGQTDSEANDAIGVYGWASAVGGLDTRTYGVYGRSNATRGVGVAGYGGPLGAGVTGYGWNGVYGESTNGRGVIGVSDYSEGVRGESYSDFGAAVQGINSDPLGTAVAGNGYFAIWGESTNGRGVTGVAESGTGVYGFSDDGYGIYAASITDLAGYFAGDVHVAGTLSGPITQSKIDHPLDPANQTLTHYGQSAPEAQNVYNGVAVLDESGAVTVTLPAYFAAVNSGTFRYQLTAIGAAMPNLHIAQKVQGRTFAIAGGAPGMEVSWELTARRDDPYARDHAAPAEQAKEGDDAGTYLYPEGYGQPQEMGMGSARPDAAAVQQP